jgi:hypothetical protein
VNIFSNKPNGRWQAQAQPYLFMADARELPNELYLDGVAAANNYPHSADPGPITLSPIYNWTIALTMRPDDHKNPGATVHICTQLDGQICSLSPSNTLASGGNTVVYFEGSHSSPYPAIDDMDRGNSRLHSSVPNCDLGHDGDSTTNPNPYADKHCDKIDYFIVYQGPGASAGTKYWCIDGACNIKIGQP